MLTAIISSYGDSLVADSTALLFLNFRHTSTYSITINALAALCEYIYEAVVTLDSILILRLISLDCHHTNNAASALPGLHSLPVSLPPTQVVISPDGPKLSLSAHRLSPLRTYRRVPGLGRLRLGSRIRVKPLDAAM